MSFALSRGNLNSATELRETIDPLALLKEGGAHVFLISPDAKLLVADGPAGAPLPGGVLSWLAETTPPSHLWFMGYDKEGDAQVGAWLTEGQMKKLGEPTPENGLAGFAWEELMTVGPDFDEETSLVATQAVALANWHAAIRHCFSCGGLLEPSGAGWTRTCTQCAAVQYPRIEPAVIVAVLDPQQRLLLVHNMAWDEPRMSLLAGYVDAGETPERAVAREVKEEAGLDVVSIEYLGSQPWPRPRSLMLAYRADVDCDEDYAYSPPDSQAAPEPEASGGLPCVQVRPDLIEVDRAQFFARDELRDALASGEVMVPGPASVAHTVIATWLEEDGGEGLKATWSSYK